MTLVQSLGIVCGAALLLAPILVFFGSRPSKKDRAVSCAVSWRPAYDQNGPKSHKDVDVFIKSSEGRKNVLIHNPFVDENHELLSAVAAEFNR